MLPLLAKTARSFWRELTPQQLRGLDHAPSAINFDDETVDLRLGARIGLRSATRCGPFSLVSMPPAPALLRRRSTWCSSQKATGRDDQPATREARCGQAPELCCLCDRLLANRSGRAYPRLDVPIISSPARRTSLGAFGAISDGKIPGAPTTRCFCNRRRAGKTHLAHAGWSTRAAGRPNAKVRYKNIHASNTERRGSGPTSARRSTTSALLPFADLLLIDDSSSSRQGRTAGRILYASRRWSAVHNRSSSPSNTYPKS